jgi:hypothetical protein
MNSKMAIALTVALAMCLWFGGAALAAGTWADEIVTATTFYKTSYPVGNWEPYFEKLTKVREGLGRGDEQIVKVEMDQFMKMLAGRAHGINDVAADELYNFALGARPDQHAASAASLDLEIGTERPMSVPEHTIQTPYEGGPPCRSAAGCDYWLDDVYDPGAAG